MREKTQQLKEFIVVLVLCLSASGCVEEAAGPRPDPGPLVVEDPPRAVYGAEATPRASLDAQDGEPSPPLPQEGGDSGDPGLIYAAALGGYYILRIQLPDGNFGYRYDAEAGTWADDDSLARQCGSTYTLSYLYEVTGREEFRVAAQWSHARIAQRMDRPLSLGSPVALWALGLTLHARATGRSDWGDGFDVDTEIDRLGAELLAIQREDGGFEREGFHAGSQFIQALWSVYTHTGDPRYLDALERGARYFYDTGLHERDLLFALWNNEPMAGLYALRPAPWILDLVWMVTDPVVEAQILPHHDVPALWVGGFILYGQPTPGALSMYGVEASIDAFRLARMVGDVERAERYRAAALLGVRFLKSLQLREGDTDSFPEPDLTIGGVPYGFDRPILRVDITRHIVNSFIKVVTYLDLEDYPARDRFLPRSTPSGGVLEAPFGPAPP